jgi:hypothetical protein
MSKPNTIPVNVEPKGEEINANYRQEGPQESLSGSHKVKNRNHTRQKNGEG